MSSNNSKTPDDGETIEKAFALLQEGKAMEKDGKNWEAADKFVRGRSILKTLALQQSRETEEDSKIAKLYEQKSAEYLKQSRQCLIAAMTKERVEDPGDDFYAKLSDDDAEARIKTFYNLFARQVEVKGEERDVIDQQWSIEERLQELNASLPSGFKTDKERMDTINKGLNRLGLSIYPQKKPFADIEESLPKSEEDQIEEIMAQAQDEVTLEKRSGMGSTTTAKAQHESEDETDDESEDDEISNADLLLDDEQLAIKIIRNKVVKAQTKLAELVAFLDEAKIAREEEDEVRDIKGTESDDDTIERPPADALLASGRAKLKGALKDIKRATKEWTESNL